MKFLNIKQIVASILFIWNFLAHTNDNIIFPDNPILSTNRPYLPTLQTSHLNFVLAQDDLSNQISHLYLSTEVDNIYEELNQIGQLYGFEVLQESGMYSWAEDNMWFSADGQFVFQPQKALADKDKYHTFITALNADIAGAEEEGHHSLGSKRSQGLNQELLQRANTLINSHGLSMVKTLSVIDGGNMLTGRRANGQPYALIGRDALLQTTLLYSHFDQERVAAHVETMQANHDFSLVLETYTERWGYTNTFQQGHDAEIDLVLLEAANLVAKDLTDTARLEFARSARAKAKLNAGSTKTSDNQMILSATQRRIITQRYEALHGGHLPKHFNMLRQLRNDYHALVTAQKQFPLYSDTMIGEKLRSFQPEAEAINRMVIMLQKGGFIRRSLDVGSPEAQYQAARFLAMTEIAKDIMANELHLSLPDLVIVSQPDFHIDMALRPLSDGYILVQDHQESRNLVQQVLSNGSSRLSEQDKIALQETKAQLERSYQQEQRIFALIHQQLEHAGLKIIKTPGVFWLNGSPADNTPLRHVNYMNGIMGTSQQDHVPFYITNASSIEALNTAFAGWIQQKHKNLAVHFVGKEAGRHKRLNVAESLLRSNGGLDCITVHHE